MARRRIASPSPYEAVYGYSRAVVDGRWCFVAGTTGADLSSGAFPDDVGEQAKNTLARITLALEEAGFALTDVVRVRYIFSEEAHIRPAMVVLAEAFADIRPAATLVVAGLVEPAMKVEVEVTALKADG